MVVLLAVLTAASSLAAASDTLRVISYRTVDICSSERRWLISVYMGEVFAGDSLQSFDITIGYDTSRIVPTDGLIIGTLSEQMKFGDVSPFFNFVVPGEIRVGAFTVTRNVKGDQPLFAVAGTYKGACNEQDAFTLPWNPEFNEEFKGGITSFVSDRITTIASPKADVTQGSLITEDTVTMQGLDKSGVFELETRADSMLGQQIVEVLTLDSPLFRIDSISSTQVDSTTLSAAQDSLMIFRTITNSDPITTSVWVTSVTNSEDTTSTLNVQMTPLSECGCTTPQMKDTLTLRSQQPTSTIVEWDVHESSDLRIWNRAGILELQCSHGQPWTVTLADLLGNIYSQTQVHAGSTQRLSLESFPRGLYMITATNGDRVRRTNVLN